MQHIKTLFPSFFIWQFFSLSPFILTKDSLLPKLSSIHNVISGISCAVQFPMLIFGLCNFQHYIVIDDRLNVKVYGDIFSMALVRCTSLLIVVESWLKRSRQISFLKMINEIDEILHRNLQIDFPYESHRKKCIRKLIVLVGLYLCLEMILLLVTFDPALKDFETFCAFYAVPLFVCMLRYQQFISFVQLLTDRFKALNHCIESLIVKKTGRDFKKEEEFSHFIYGRSFYIGQDKKLEAHLIMNKIKHLRRIYHLLIEANNDLCRLFNWSMLLNVSNDFCNVLINSYWMILNLIHNGSRNEFLAVFSWTVFNLSMLISLSKACYFACNEVNVYF